MRFLRINYSSWWKSIGPRLHLDWSPIPQLLYVMILDGETTHQENIDQSYMSTSKKRISYVAE